MCVGHVVFPTGANGHAAGVAIAAEDVDDAVGGHRAGGDVAVEAGFRIPIEFARVGIQPPDLVGHADHEFLAAAVQRASSGVP